MKNPYAPPVEAADLHAPGEEVPESGLSLTDEGWQIITSLTRWMRIVGVFYYILGALVGVGVLLALISGGAMLLGVGGGLGAKWGELVVVAVAIFGALAVLLILGAVFLRRAAFHFYDGILSDTESSLARGFRKLRIYLILFGIYGILELVKDVIELVSATR